MTLTELPHGVTVAHEPLELRVLVQIQMGQPRIFLDIENTFCYSIGNRKSQPKEQEMKELLPVNVARTFLEEHYQKNRDVIIEHVNQCINNALQTGCHIITISALPLNKDFVGIRFFGGIDNLMKELTATGYKVHLQDYNTGISIAKELVIEIPTTQR